MTRFRSWEPGKDVEGPLVALPASGAVGITTVGVTGNTTGQVGLFYLPVGITVTDLRIEATSVGAAGTLDIGIYSNDGQRKLIDVTTGSISGAGDEDVSLGTPVYLTPGLYYVVVVPNGSANVTIRCWQIANSPFDGAAPAGLNEVSGTITVTASTLPTSFDPDADVTFAVSKLPLIRIN